MFDRYTPPTGEVCSGTYRVLPVFSANSLSDYITLSMYNKLAAGIEQTDFFFIDRYSTHHFTVVDDGEPIEKAEPHYLPSVVSRSWATTAEVERDDDRRPYAKQFITWHGDGDQLGTKDCAAKAQVMTERRGAWVNKHGEVMICDLNGDNEQLLFDLYDLYDHDGFTMKSYQVDAMYKDLIFYHCDESGGDSLNMVYNMETQEHKAVPQLPEDAHILGYTSSAVYFTRGDNDYDTYRESMDYETI